MRRSALSPLAILGWASGRSGRGIRGPAAGRRQPSAAMGDPPSDQSLWLCRSPRRAARSSAAAVGERLLPALAQVREVVGHFAVDRLADHLVGPVADTLHAFEPAVPGAGCHLVRRPGRR